MSNVCIEYIPTSSILRHPRNPKKHSEDQIHRLEASIQKFGWTSPIILSSDDYILAGHARYEAALNQGIAEVPCIRTVLNGDDAIANGAEMNGELSSEQVYGEMIMIKITDELYDYIEIHGGDVGIERGEDGIYTLA